MLHAPAREATIDIGQRLREHFSWPERKYHSTSLDVGSRGAVAAPRDALGNQAMLRMGLPSAPLAAVRPSRVAALQRKCACGGGCLRCRGEADIEPKLAIGQSGDALEQDADGMAEEAMRVPDQGLLDVGSAALRTAAPAESALPSKSASCDESSPDMLHVERNQSGASEPAAAGAPALAVPAVVHAVLRSPGQPLDPVNRTFFEQRFGRDFTHVRVHSDARAAESAQSVGALAFAVGNHIVIGPTRDAPGTAGYRKLLAHEVAHTVQQRATNPGDMRPVPPIAPTRSGGYRVAVASAAGEGPAFLEHQADQAADHVIGKGSGQFRPGPTLSESALSQPSIQRQRIPLPSSVALCGKTLTHIDIEPFRQRELIPCLPAGFLVNRMNIVGRDLSVPPPPGGMGRQVFNLHVGYFTDPATGRFCAIADDSKMCLMGRCVSLGCFATLQEVVDAILEFLKKLLIVIGVIALALVVVAIILLLSPVLAPALAGADDAGGPDGGVAVATADSGNGSDGGDAAQAEA